MKPTTLLLTACTVSSFGTWGSTRIAASVPELTALVAAANAGDTLLLKSGTYKDAVLKLVNANGTEKAPVVIAAEQAGKVSFEGSSRLSFSGQYIVVSGFVWQNGGELGTKSVVEFRTDKTQVATHCTLEDCVINKYNGVDKAVDNKWVYLYGQYNTVSRCLFKDKDNKGPTLTVWLENGVGAYHLITQNYFLGRSNGPQLENGLETLRIGLGATAMTDAYCTVSENRFEDCDGEVETISNKASHNSYLYNTFYNCDGGLTLRHGNNCLVHGNYFFGGKGKRSYGVRIIGEGHKVQYNYCYGLNGAADKFRAPMTLVNGFPDAAPNSYTQVKRAVVANNTFINCITPTIRIGAGKEGATEAPDSCVFINNLVFQADGSNGTGHLFDYIARPQHTTSSNNYYHLPAKNTQEGWKELDGSLMEKGKLYYLPAGKYKGELAYVAGDKDATGNLLKGNSGVGAISGAGKEMIKHPLQPNEVGPLWLR